ncbi:MAG TPA: TetR/AcrR family transcriptional regulator, partial [Hyphomonadaceae bacterium]|nr:TetR/AcrR family transcriptional regulator [Hyphomonadaceae bacterium]
MTETTDTREQILRAAMTRILHYGYAKTTMAEIAKDCDMSAGNIYRFFKSKLDIAEAIVRGFNQAFYQLFAEIARRSDEPALPRLTKLFKA